MPLSVGDRLARYEIRGFLGAGGMGEVYRAHDRRLDRDVAIKVLPEGFKDSPDRLRRFEREARAAAALNHPNILDVHDLGDHQGRPFIVTELLEGASLRDVIASGPLTLEKAQNYGRQIAAGLAAAHDSGITHRDLKPANIFLTADGAIKILDFGLAKAAPPTLPPAEALEASTRSMVTEAGTVLGTPGYMSPEQVRGLPADHRSDVFAFGVVLYEMLSRKRPFSGATSAEVQASILKDEPPRLSDLNPDVPAPLERLVGRCLEKRPEDRFKSTRDLLLALEEVTAIPSTVEPDRPSRVLLRRALLPAAAIATVILVVLVLQPSTEGVPFNDRDWLLITNVENLTGDATFDRALGPALTVAIEQSSYVNVLSRSSIQSVLQQMKREDATVIDENLGREIARRKGIDVMLVPSISQLGARYVLTASIKGTATGGTYASRFVPADCIDEVLPSLDRLSHEIRRDLGETLASITEHSEPLVPATTSSLEALEQFSLAIEHHVRSDFNGARQYFESALHIDPNFTSAKVSLGILHFDNEGLLDAADPIEGRRLLTEAAAEIDDLTDLERMRALAYYARFVEGDLDHAVDLFQSLLSIYPDLPPTHQSLARIFEHMGRYTEAASEYREAIRLDSGFIIAYNGYVWLLVQHFGDVDAIITWATREIEVDDHQVWPHLNLCLAYLGKGDTELALAAATRALEINADYPTCHYYLGHALRQSGRFLDAARAFEAVLEINPYDFWAHYHAGVALNDAGDTHAARKRYRAFKESVEAWIEGHPDDSNWPIVLDQVLVRLGEEPRVHLTNEQLESSDPQFNFLVARMYSLQGRTEEALHHVKRAIDEGVKNPIWVIIHPDFDPIRDDPRFQDLKRRTLNLEER